ncbi:MAG TPA: SusC/RagA family TonB-linked outer membrane protein [Panacibacter sp.]|nr:SusC/RagA family TonB-linked outer membrane protein [Panacibacter sp.]HNP46088.1 SusC/RagA family TonB-linked outer membrane protein [Panacibacter sp.]
MRKLMLSLAGVFLLFLLPDLLYAQGKTVTGKVTDISGLPMAGVSVSVLKSTQGTVTDADGKFKIQVADNASIVFSFTGFKSQTFKVSDASGDLSIKMEEDIGKLEEVVVMGLATTVKRKNLSNAVGTISAKQLNGVAPAQTFDAALNGKIPGAYINANSGAPGGGLSVKLRGVTSIFGNTQPLYVVDGVFMDNTATSGGLNAVTQAAAGGNASTQDNPSSRIADLRAEDIQNIEILKGASAAAIYGSRAAAGVIIITTKRGSQGKTKISFSQDFGFAKARHLLGVRQFTAETAGSLSSDPETSAALSQQFTEAKAAGKLYDYEKEIYGNTGFMRNSVLSVTGGGEKTSFYFSAAQKDEEGIVKGTGYRNTSLRLNLDHKITDNIKIGLSTNYVNSSSDRGLTGNDNTGTSYSISLSSTPNFVDLHPDQYGNYPINPFSASNVLQTIALMTNNESVNRFTTGINLDAILQKSNKSTTRLIGRGGIDFYSLYTTALFPRELQFQNVNKGTSIQGATQNLNTNSILSLVNVYNASDNLAFTTSAGVTQETGDYNNLLNVATQVAPGQSNIDQGGALTGQQFRNKFQNEGIFVQEEVSINDALNVNAGVRFDRSTNNGDATKFYTYPKAGASLNLTKLGVLDKSIFNNIKLRAAYGQSANFPAYGSKFTTLVSSNTDGLQGSIVNVQGGDPNIKPERQAEFETGIDFSMANSKVNFEITYYRKKIFDFLLLATVPPSSGFSQKFVNAGDLQNSGLEVGINAQPISTKAIKWTTSLNFWFNRSKVTKLTIPPVILGSFGTSLGTFRIEEGKSATQIVGNDAPTHPSGEIVVLGNQEPTFQMNTFNEITFKNRLSLRFLIHWKNGGDNVNLTNLLNDFGQTSADFDADDNGNNIPNGPERIGSFLGGSARGFVQDAGYVRFREIGLYYSFSKIPGNVVRGLRVGVALNNYITFTKYAGYDPEVSNFGTGFSTGVDVDPYPASKRASLNITIDF